MRITLYHNPRCSKSRQALALLEAQPEVELEVIGYLDAPPSADELDRILGMLGMQPRQLMRRKEAEFHQLRLNDRTLDRSDLVAAMAAHPKLIERPIAVGGGRAVIGRPPERVLELLT
jgi:arsenate reductase